jgi:cysteine desulfurase
MTASKTMVPRMVTSAIEHPAVLEAAKVRGATILSVDGSGRINLADLKSAITDQTELISIGYANSEIGTVQDLRAVSEICAEVRQQRSKRGLLRPLVLHTDASQAAGYLDINVARLGVDMMTLNAGKCYGPKGIGLLYVRAGITLRPLIFGGGQESGWRSGTENVAGAIGFGLALELAAKKRQTETERLSKLRDLIEQFLLEEFPQAKINGHHKHRLPNILNFSIDGLDGERAVFALDERGVMVATGSACAANKNSRSQALAAIGLTSTEIDGSLRISLGRPVSVSAIDQLKPILAKTLRQQLKFGASHG